MGSWKKTTAIDSLFPIQLPALFGYFPVDAPVGKKVKIKKTRKNEIYSFNDKN